MVRVLCTARITTSIREELPDKYPELDFYFRKSMDEEAIKLLPEAEILLTYGEDLTENLIEKATKLKWINVLSAGLDKMPFEAIKKRGIVVTNSRGIHKTPMAEYTIAMMLQYARNAKQLIKHEHEHKWDRTVPMAELYGKTAVIVGAGAIGQEIARLARAFGMKTIGVNRDGRPVNEVDSVYQASEYETFLREGDFIINVLPATVQTHHYFTYDKFSLFKASAVFINIGRGETVDEVDLMKALQEGAFAHAILDVFKTEPLPENHPFWKMDQVTVTPHLSGISPQYHPRAFEIFEENLKAYQTGSGLFQNEIDLDRGY